MRRPDRKLPKGIWFQKKRLSDGRVVRYGYFGRGPGTVALGLEGSVAFVERLASALHQTPTAGTLRNLIWQYKQSPEYARLRPLTRRDYAKLLDKIDGRFGALSLAAMASREIARHIYLWRDSMKGTPRRADYAIQVLKALLSWGFKRGLVEHNRAAGVERLSRGDRREKTWSDDQIAAFLSNAPEPLGRAMILAIETGQRQGDLLLLPWNAIEGGVIKLRQSKTRVRVSVPISAELQARLDRIAKSDATTILTTGSGHPWDPKGNGFRAAWRDACAKAGVKGVTFHDLRGTFVTRRLAAGWTTQEVAMCTGHSLRDLTSLDTYADRGSIADATAARLAQNKS